MIGASFFKELIDLGMTKLEQTTNIKLMGIHGNILTLPLISVPCSLLGTSITIDMAISDEPPSVLPSMSLYGLPIKDILADVLAVTRQDTVAEKRQQVEHQEEITEQSDLEDHLICPDFNFSQSILALPSMIAAEADTTDQSQDNIPELIRDQKADVSLMELWNMVAISDSPFVLVHALLHSHIPDGGTKDPARAPQEQV